MLITLGTFVTEHFINCTNCGANATVTAVHSSGRVYTATANASGNATIKVYDDGAFTVSENGWGQSKSINVPAATESVNCVYHKYLYKNGIGKENFTAYKHSQGMGSVAEKAYNGYMSEQCMYGFTDGAWYGAGALGIYFRSGAIDLTPYSTLYMRIKGYTGTSYDKNGLGFGISTSGTMYVNNSGDYDQNNSSIEHNAEGNPFYLTKNISESLASLNIANVTGSKYIFCGASTNFPYVGYGTASFKVGISEIYLD